MRLLFTATLFFIVAACATSGGVSAARVGDRKTLMAYAAPLHQKGKIEDSDAVDMAQATLLHEIEKSEGEAAIERILDVRPCAFQLESALRKRAETHDRAGAEAALTLYEASLLSAGKARDWMTDRDPEWRAVATRALVREKDQSARNAAFTDPRAEIRRAAMRAAAVANDARDVDALFEAARLDPVPMARNEAIRAIARIESAPSDTANRLRDLWNHADDGLREDIALAYAAPQIAKQGGAEALRVLIGREHGPGVISAALAVLRDSKKLFDAETRASAVALLANNITSGSRRDRSFAIAVAPMSDPVLATAIQKAAKDGDDDIRLSVLARLLEIPGERSNAVTQLETFAQPAESNASLAHRARNALAEAGDLRIQAWIETDLSNEDPSVRLGAADALARLGRSARAVLLLADADARVRTRAACTLVRSAHAQRR